MPRFQPEFDEKDEEAEAKLRHCRLGVMPQFKGFPDLEPGIEVVGCLERISVASHHLVH